MQETAKSQAKTIITPLFQICRRQSFLLAFSYRQQLRVVQPYSHSKTAGKIPLSAQRLYVGSFRLLLV